MKSSPNKHTQANKETTDGQWSCVDPPILKSNTK